MGRKQLSSPEQTGEPTRLPQCTPIPKGVSGYGTWNQSGNVMEWCSIWHDEPDSATTVSREETLSQERGGCWRYPDKFALRCAQRSFVVSKAVNDFRGFRLVLPVQAGE